MAPQPLRLDVVDRPVEAAELEGGAQLVAERLGPLAQIGGMVGGGLDRDRERADGEGGRHVRQKDLLDHRTLVLEDLERRLDRGHDLGIALLEEEPAGDADAAPGDAVREPGRVVRQRPRHAGRVARIVARQHLQQQRRIAHGPGQRAGVVLRPGRAATRRISIPGRRSA